MEAYRAREWNMVRTTDRYETGEIHVLTAQAPEVSQYEDRPMEADWYELYSASGNS